MTYFNINSKTMGAHTSYIDYADITVFYNEFRERERERESY